MIMVKSAAERQAEFRAKSKGKFLRLDTLLPVGVFNLLHGNAKGKGLTKAAYIDKLLHGNDLKNSVPNNQDKELVRLQGAVEELELDRAAIKKQLKACSDDREAKQALKKERDALLAQVKELKRVVALDALIINDMRVERDKLLHGNKQKPANTDSITYDGNSKGFKAALVSIVGNDNNVVSAERKKAYAALNIVPKKNGQLSTDSERLRVFEWLRNKNT